MASVQNIAKQALRKSIQDKLGSLSLENVQEQSNNVAQKLLSMEAYKNSKVVSVYLSTTGELSTIEILKRMFMDNKEVFVPTYKGEIMEMVQLNGMDDYERLPVTKWNIKQPKISDKRVNALSKGGIDLILLPGVAFTIEGDRCGHGRGYYDKYLKRYFELFPEKYAENMPLEDKAKNGKTILIGLALKEQIVKKDELPLDEHDFPLDFVLFDENAE